MQLFGKMQQILRSGMINPMQKMNCNLHIEELTVA